ncbi:MAG: glycosyltransferase family 9 protein [Deltaproteobacteria bacterium]|nr:glycosyltransferase family 9 protein [Deltaproteobacteria bacterium]
MTPPRAVGEEPERPALVLSDQAVFSDAERIALPRLRIGERCSFVFAASGGLGDIFVALQVALAWRQRVSAESDGHEWAFASVHAWYSRIAPFVRELGVFDHVLDFADGDRFPALLSHSPTYLPALLGGNDDDAKLGIGTTLDFLWSSWGMPGRFVPLTSAEPVARLRERVLAPRYEQLRPSREWPLADQFVLLCPQSNYLSGLKNWPVAAWRALVRSIQDRGQEVVVCGTQEACDALEEGASRPCHRFDYSDPGLSGDITNLASVVNAARATVCLDSGPAHLASLLERPCISLWGPTSPALYASPNNVVLRASLCPPCSTDGRASLCTNNACMQAIQPASVTRLLHRIRSTPSAFA